jgi:hypothetical protein
MKAKLVPAFCALLLATVVTGCIATADGHTRAAVPFRKDRIISRYEVPVDKVFETAKKVLAANGSLDSENRINNSLVARQNARTIYIRVKEFETGVSEVTTQVRTRWGGADIDLAAELDKQIALGLAK